MILETETLDVQFSELAEYSLIDAMLLDSDFARRVLDSVQDSDMYVSKYKPWLSSIRTVVHRRQHEAWSTEAYTRWLEELVPGVVMERDRALKVVKDKSARRFLSSLADRIKAQANDSTIHVSEIADAMRDGVLTANPKLSQSHTENMIKAFEYINNPPATFCTYIPALDNALVIKNSDLCVIAARPAVGKTALGISILLNSIQNGKKVAMYCGELSPEEVYFRFWSQQYGIPNSSFINAGPGSKSYEGLKSISQDWIDTDQDQHWLLAGVQATITDIRNWLYSVRPDFAVIDYLQRIKPPRGSKGRVEDVAMFAQELRCLAIELKIPIIALAQLNRDSDGAKPKMSHLKGSGDIEQEASQIILLDRPEAEPHIPSSREYNDSQGNSVKMTNPNCITGNTAAIIAKSRHSATAVALLKFEGEFGRFSSYSPGVPYSVSNADVPPRLPHKD